MIFFPVYLSTFLFNKLYVVLHHLFYTVALQKTTILLIYRPKKTLRKLNKLYCEQNVNKRSCQKKMTEE